MHRSRHSLPVPCCMGDFSTQTRLRRDPAQNDKAERTAVDTRVWHYERDAFTYIRLRIEDIEYNTPL